MSQMLLRKFLCITLISLFNLSCDSDGYKTTTSTNLVADVLALTDGAPNTPAETPAYTFGPQRFSILTDIAKMDAPGLRLIQGGDIEIFAQAGSLITNGFFSGGKDPYFNYSEINGIVKPNDHRTLTMLSSMYQFDALMTALPNLSGYKKDELLEGSQGFQVIFQPSILIDEDGDKIRRYETGNAAYIAGAKQFALYKTGTGENIPLAINPQVIAHEFGHAIFEFSFFQNSYQKCERSSIIDERNFPGRLELEYIIRGLNEGFADFVSFVWSGSSNLLESSFGSTVQTAERNFANINYTYATLNDQSSLCTGEIYCIGSLFARALLDAFVTLGFDVKSQSEREQYLRSVFGTLRGAGEKLRAGKDYALPFADDQVAACKLRNSRSVLLDDEILGVFLGAFVDSAPVDQKQAFCGRFAEQFGESGFALRYRSGCP